MIKKATFALIAATAVVSLASPAFAQTADRYGSTMPYHYDSSGSQVWGSWGPKEQGSTGSSQSKASASRSQSAKHHPRGHEAFGYAPAQR